MMGPPDPPVRELAPCSLLATRRKLIVSESAALPGSVLVGDDGGTVTAQRKLLRQLPSLNFGPANHDRQPRHGTLDPDE